MPSTIGRNSRRGSYLELIDFQTPYGYATIKGYRENLEKFLRDYPLMDELKE